MEEPRFVPSPLPRRRPLVSQRCSVCLCFVWFLVWVFFKFFFFKIHKVVIFSATCGGANQYEGAPFSLKPEVNKL